MPLGAPLKSIASKVLGWLPERFAARLGEPVPVFYHEAYRLPLASLEQYAGADPRRVDFTAWYLLERRILTVDDFHAPEPISLTSLARVHTEAYLESLQSAEVLAGIFSVDPSDVPIDGLLHALRLACGGTLAAARMALERRGPVMNLSGGFHHAAPTRGGGFCALDDIGTAVATLRAGGFKGKVAVLDLDAHQPDGLAESLAKDLDAWIGSLTGSIWSPLPGVDEISFEPPSGPADEASSRLAKDGSSPLAREASSRLAEEASSRPEGESARGAPEPSTRCDDETYLKALGELLGRMPRAALTFVIAGGDVLAGDRLGMLGLTLDGARRRDLRVAEHLEGRASVWLPAGGYHPDSWKVHAGTALALTGLGRRRIEARFDPLSARYQNVARLLQQDRLQQDRQQGELELTSADLDGSLQPGSGDSRLLGYYTAQGIEYALFRYGVLGQIERLGYRALRVDILSDGAGDRLRLLGRPKQPGPERLDVEHLLVDVVLERRRMVGADFLFVNWLTLRHPVTRFSDRRPRLPGQEVPGLGLSPEVSALLERMAQRLALAGLAFRPSWYHLAYIARHRGRFTDPERQGRFVAAIRDLERFPLIQVTHAMADGRVLLNGEPYIWEADDMVTWLDARPGDEQPTHARDAADREEIEAVASASHFELAAPLPSGRGDTG